MKQEGAESGLGLPAQENDSVQVIGQQETAGDPSARFTVAGAYDQRWEDRPMKINPLMILLALVALVQPLKAEWDAVELDDAKEVLGRGVTYQQAVGRIINQRHAQEKANQILPIVILTSSAIPDYRLEDVQKRNQKDGHVTPLSPDADERTLVPVPKSEKIISEFVVGENGLAEVSTSRPEGQPVTAHVSGVSDRILLLADKPLPEAWDELLPSEFPESVRFADAVVLLREAYGLANVLEGRTTMGIDFLCDCDDAIITVKGDGNGVRTVRDLVYAMLVHAVDQEGVSTGFSVKELNDDIDPELEWNIFRH